MIVVAVLATFIALAFYPSQESGTASAKHDIPVGVPPVPVPLPVTLTDVRMDVAAPKLDEERTR
jgi:hypothetical protein